MSGFVGKLFSMVNESPNDIVDWLPSGDAFQILDLERLESQTLPLHFRHSRFQSLVRQLNFYNFRKVNRERTFWVYKHPLFHRDHPEMLPHLRRKTCPGVDGRRSKDEPITTGANHHRGTEEKRQPSGTRSSARVGRPPRNHDAYTPVVSVAPHSFSSTSSVVGGSSAPQPSASLSSQPASSAAAHAAQQQQQAGPGGGSDGEFPGYGHLGGSAHNSRSGSPSFDLSSSFDEAYGNKRKAGLASNSNRAERSERSQMVASVSQQLEAYAKRARTASGSSNGIGSGRSSTPVPFGTSSHFSSSFNQIPKTPSSAFCPKLTISLPTNPVTDAHPSIHVSSPHYATLSSTPITDLSLTSMIASKISKVSPETNAALTRFCLSTPPTAILDPKTKEERLQELFGKDNRVKEDFNRYRDALNPNSSFDWCGNQRAAASTCQPVSVKSESSKSAVALATNTVVDHPPSNEKENDNANSVQKELNNAVTLELEGELAAACGALLDPPLDDTNSACDPSSRAALKSSPVSTAITAGAAAAAAAASSLSFSARPVDMKDFTPFCINHLRDTFKEGYEKHGFTEREVEAVENAIRVWFRAAMVTQ
ncbi:hypothetical protein TrRE_jg9819 [Triparma retinervis]|uniref:HSF-type DNA-binding domain-containing protein n=1 Tax=Triparma retinervis TaxID=2557542 RepID=A0A9W7KRS1_9STRA|nr:hypothetical protein TrRE_jg9819 [Triparma retinervis]